MTDVEKAKNIYHELCSRMVYDNSALEDFERKNSYYAYLHNSGVCVIFANVYNQLLTQVGNKTTTATCEYDVDCQLKIVQKLFSQRESLKLNRS